MADFVLFCSTRQNLSLSPIPDCVMIRSLDGKYSLDAYTDISIPVEDKGSKDDYADVVFKDSRLHMVASVIKWWFPLVAEDMKKVRVWSLSPVNDGIMLSAMSSALPRTLAPRCILSYGEGIMSTVELNGLVRECRSSVGRISDPSEFRYGMLLSISLLKRIQDTRKFKRSLWDESRRFGAQCKIDLEKMRGSLVRQERVIEKLSIKKPQGKIQ